jgi:hypothetical protein
MKYMLMMNTPRGTGDYQINEWSADDFKAHIAFMHRFNNELSQAGEWVDAQGLTPPAQAKLVRAGKGGVPVTDSVFPEAKEFLAGFCAERTGSIAERNYLLTKAARVKGEAGRSDVAPQPPAEVEED